MKSWILGLLALSCVSGVALSDPVTYDFTVTATNGPLSGDVSDGSFTFTSSIAPPGGGLVNEPGLLTDLSFAWDGITYNASTANTGRLNFDASGNLTSLLFGNSCPVFAGCAAGGSPGSKDWFVFGVLDGPGSGFVYAFGNEGVFNGTVSFSLASPEPPPASAPEPATVSLLALGLAGIALVRRRGRFWAART
jgi:hypothetical protein